MKDSKRRIELFAMYDHSGIARHLERMAEKGWMLEKITAFSWHYRRVPPQRQRFAVTYYPKATPYDPGPPEELAQYYDLCAHTGWTLVATDAQMQIFSNPQSSPIPLETDPGLAVETIHRSMKGWIVGTAVILVISLFLLLSGVFEAFQDPLALLSSGQALFFALVGLLATPLTAAELWRYLSWRAAAVQAAAQGVFLETKSVRLPQMVAAGLLLAGLGVWIATASPGEWMSTVLGLLGVAIGLLLRQILRDRGTMAETNQSIVWGLVLFVGLAAGALAGSGPWTSIERTTVDHWLHEPPLAVADFAVPIGQDKTWGDLCWGEESPLLGSYTYGKLRVNFMGVRQDVDVNTLRYTLTAPKLPGLYGLCEAMMARPWEPPRQWQYREEVPAQAWGAQRAYQLVEETEVAQGTQHYLLCYPHVLVDISFAWPVNEVQMALVGEKLGNIRL